jgi:hypothetical protein
VIQPIKLYQSIRESGLRDEKDLARMFMEEYPPFPSTDQSHEKRRRHKHRKEEKKEKAKQVSDSALEHDTKVRSGVPDLRDFHPPGQIFTYGRDPLNFPPFSLLDRDVTPQQRASRGEYEGATITNKHYVHPFVDPRPVHFFDEPSGGGMLDDRAPLRPESRPMTRPTIPGNTSFDNLETPLYQKNSSMNAYVAGLGQRRNYGVRMHQEKTADHRYPLFLRQQIEPALARNATMLAPPIVPASLQPMRSDPFLSGKRNPSSPGLGDRHDYGVSKSPDKTDENRHPIFISPGIEASPRAPRRAPASMNALSPFTPNDAIHDTGILEREQRLDVGSDSHQKIGLEIGYPDFQNVQPGIRSESESSEAGFAIPTITALVAVSTTRRENQTDSDTGADPSQSEDEINEASSGNGESAASTEFGTPKMMPSAEDSFQQSEDSTIKSPAENHQSPAFIEFGTPRTYIEANGSPTSKPVRRRARLNENGGSERGSLKLLSVYFILCIVTAYSVLALRQIYRPNHKLSSCDRKN